MKILTVISNYNEQGAVGDVITAFRETSPVDSDLLVIDNCSSDRSIDIIKQHGAAYLEHPVNSGGSAGVIKTALLYAYLNNYDVYCHMDGDNQHNADELAKLVKPIEDGVADIVIGSRFIKFEGFQSLPIRRQGISFFSKLFSRITGQPITDITSGFRAYNKKAISFFAGQYKHELEACVQMLLVASYAGLSIKEVPVVMKPRRTGKSEINYINGMKFPIYGMISIVGVLLQKKTIKDMSNAIIS